jgi:hypothetical protein
MKRIIFLLATVMISCTGQAQRISDTAPTSFEGETIYLVLKSVQISQQVLDFCDNKFAGGNLVVLETSKYYAQVKTGDGYILAPIAEKIGDNSNCWLTLYKAGAKAVIKKPAITGVFAKDPALKQVASYLVDQGKLGTLYSAFYVKSLETMLTEMRDLSSDVSISKMSDKTLLEEASLLVLSESDVQSEFNRPEKIRNIHPSATIFNMEDIQKRIVLKTAEVGFVETLVQYENEGSTKEFIRVNRGNGDLVINKEIHTSKGLALINREILEDFMSEKQIEQAAGKK